MLTSRVAGSECCGAELAIRVADIRQIEHDQRATASACSCLMLSFVQGDVVIRCTDLAAFTTLNFLRSLLITVRSSMLLILCNAFLIAGLFGDRRLRVADDWTERDGPRQSDL